MYIAGTMRLDLTNEFIIILLSLCVIPILSIYLLCAEIRRPIPSKAAFSREGELRQMLARIMRNNAIKSINNRYMMNTATLSGQF